jgi:26S proteasome non-ATPase regulatory subunit 9
VGISYIVRTTRARIIYLRNDYKDVMAKVEQGIHAHFASLSEAQTALSDAAPQSPVPADIMEAEPMPSWPASTSTSDVIESPFARVNSVAPGSPAAQAGMKAGDKIRSFGTVNWMNHENLTKIAQLVQQNEGVSETSVALPSRSN